MGGCRSPDGKCEVREELCSHLFANLSGLAGLGSGGRQGHKLFDYLHVPQSQISSKISLHRRAC